MDIWNITYHFRKQFAFLRTPSGYLFLKDFSNHWHESFFLWIMISAKRTIDFAALVITKNVANIPLKCHLTARLEHLASFFLQFQLQQQRRHH